MTFSTKNIIGVIEVLSLLGLLSCNFSIQKQDNLSNRSDSLEITSSYWRSEELDTLGRFCRYTFENDGTYSCTSEIPAVGITVMTGFYKQNSDTLILDKDTVLMKNIGSDTIAFSFINRNQNDYRIFRLREK